MEPQFSAITSEQRVGEDPHKDLKAKLAQFILSLIQAFLRTGYYTPDHPESRKARVGLYEEFQGLFMQKDELAFLVKEDPTGKDILIEGVLPETQHLNRIMLRGMAEMYAPRFAGFLERKDLVSLTLKQTMTRQEFTCFVDIMSEPRFGDTWSSGDKERFSQALKERGILNISYIFNEDLLAVGQNIPWRARVALSRLKKDLKTIPFYVGLDTEGRRRVRHEIVQDVTRPIRSGEVIYHVLKNTDLAQTKELQVTELDSEIIASLSDVLLLKSSRALIKEVSRLNENDTPRGKIADLAKSVAASLNERNIDGREAVLERYFRQKLVPFEQLPLDTRRRIELEHLTNKFLRYSRTFFAQFDRVQDKERYLHLARSFAKLIPELIRRDRYSEVLRIIDHIDRHFREKKNLSIYAGQILEEIGSGEIPQTLADKFLNEKKEIRLAIAPIFLKLHVGSVPYLLSVLRESEDQWVRKHACEILVQIGSSAINFLLSELNKKELRTESITDIIRVLGEMKADKWIQSLDNTLQVYLRHDHPRLREAALDAYSKIRGHEGEKLYMDVLQDPDPGVKKKAIQCLGRMQSQAGLAKFMDMLGSVEAAPPEAKNPLETRLFAVLGFYENGGGFSVESLEDYLLGTLHRRLSLGTLKFLMKKNPLGEEAVAAICESLGKIGTRKSLSTLQRLEKVRGSPWENKAREAIRKIRERRTGNTQARSG